MPNCAPRPLTALFRAATFARAVTIATAVLWSTACQPRGPSPSSRKTPRTTSPRGIPQDAAPRTAPQPAPQPATRTQSSTPRSRKTHTASATPPHTPKLNLTLTLSATPKRLTMARRSGFMIRFTARNNGTTVVDPLLHKAILFVNGKRSMSWGLAISNGLRPSKWYALPPGESIGLGWPLGKALFPKPGTYTLVLRHGTTSSASLKVTVLP